MVWQRDLKYFNTVALTQTWTTFFTVQMFRLFAAVSLLCIWIVLFYIFVKRAFFILQFYSLLATTLTFFLLFIGSGMQVCEQKTLMQGKRSSRKLLGRLWRKGLFLYT